MIFIVIIEYNFLDPLSMVQRHSFHPLLCMSLLLLPPGVYQAKVLISEVKVCLLWLTGVFPCSSGHDACPHTHYTVIDCQLLFMGLKGEGGPDVTIDYDMFVNTKDV